VCMLTIWDWIPWCSEGRASVSAKRSIRSVSAREPEWPQTLHFASTEHPKFIRHGSAIFEVPPSNL
jgi:hypothetical protein